MKTTFSSHVIKTNTDITVEPGHQIIMVGPADPDAMSILFTLTGVVPNNQTRMIDLEGHSWVCAAHDERADARLVALVDLAANLRFTAPYMMQLRLQDGT